MPSCSTVLRWLDQERSVRCWYWFGPKQTLYIKSIPSSNTMLFRLSQHNNYCCLSLRKRRYAIFFNSHWFSWKYLNSFRYFSIYFLIYFYFNEIWPILVLEAWSGNTHQISLWNVFWRDLSIGQGLLPLKSSPSFPAGRTEAGLTKGGECPQVLQRNTINCVHRTCKIESFSHLFLSAFNPLQPSASLVQILYCVLLLEANTFPCSYKTPQRGSLALAMSCGLSHRNMPLWWYLASRSYAFCNLLQDSGLLTGTRNLSLTLIPYMVTGIAA